ncbi:MAG: ribulose-phosphate 3-epimerase, partial [Candidatus Binataceae bacterium]
HELGARASVAINPETPVERILAAAEHLDMILVMSVHPGFGGQDFIPESLAKLRRVKRELESRGLNVDIEVDGGIKVGNVAQVTGAGANVLVSGSGIFRHGDYAQIIAHMRENAAVSD